MSHMNEICSQMNALRTEFDMVSSIPWFALSIEQKMDFVRNEIKENPGEFISTLQSPNLIAGVVDSMLTKEALGKYMLKYPLRSYAKIAEKYDNMFQQLFSHFQNPELYVTLGLELEYFSDKDDKVLPFPIKTPVMKTPWQFMSSAMYHHWFGEMRGYWKGKHSTEQGHFKYETAPRDIHGVPIIVIDREGTTNGCMVVPRVFAPVAMELWKKDTDSTGLSSLVQHFRLDENIAQMSNAIKKEHPWIQHFYKYKAFAVEANNLHRQCMADIEFMHRQYFTERKAEATVTSGAVVAQPELLLPPPGRFGRVLTCAN